MDGRTDALTGSRTHTHMHARTRAFTHSRTYSLLCAVGEALQLSSQSCHAKMQSGVVCSRARGLLSVQPIAA
eukprot:3929237-Rhodomonas_salina.1